MENALSKSDETVVDLFPRGLQTPSEKALEDIRAAVQVLYREAIESGDKATLERARKIAELVAG